ncbi:hypothetical protein V1460_25200 [Streptomyces sp. SCSIO 30461]|uniref:hypothetical protein n=1 Tax=Streptomyces sp. SCSIO 30461 TaxID=3118085 RepID=UPI0030D240B7
MALGIAVIFGLLVLLPLMALLSYGVGRKTSTGVGWWWAAATMGIPTVLVVGWLITTNTGSNSEPEPKADSYVVGNPYEPGTKAAADYDFGRDLATELVDKGEGPGSGMADDVTRWCTEQLDQAVASGEEVTEAMAKGCISAA